MHNAQCHFPDLVRDLCQISSRGVASTEEFYLSHTARVHISDALAPFHKSHLDIVVAFDCHKVAIFIAVSELEHALADTTAGETGELGIDAINERLVCDIEGYHESDIVACLAVDSNLELRRHRHVWAGQT